MIKVSYSAYFATEVLDLLLKSSADSTILP